MTEDLDPIETAIDWLRAIVKNHGVLSPHDFDHVIKTVVPAATLAYIELSQNVSKLSDVIDVLSKELNQLKEDIKFLV